MKYNSNNKPLVCMQTQSKCYKGTTKMTVKGVLWHSTGANNPNLKRYVQPSDTKPAADTYSKTKWLEILGKNSYANDWNHQQVQAGLNCWIGKLADGTVTTVQTMPWDYSPWGCGKGSKGTCNHGWIQFEICEDNLKDATYFNKVYKEACELTAYLCKMYNIDPNGTVKFNGVNVPTILCHYDSHKLGLGSNHGDIDHWFPKHGKSMKTVRADVAALLKEAGVASPATPVAPSVGTVYKVVTPIKKYTTAADAASGKNSAGTYAAGTYYIFNKYPNGVNGMLNISTDKTGASAGSWINPAENVIKESAQPEVKKLYRVRKSKDDAASQKGAFSELANAKDCCQAAGAGYHVFDWDYKIVYSYTAPVVEKPKEDPKPEPTTPTPEVKPVAVYDLDYPEKTLIIDKSLKNDNRNTACTKVIKKILSNNPSFNIDIAKAFFELAPKYNVDPTMAIAQSILETGWFKFAGSSVSPSQNNFCGLGATGGSVAGATFKTFEDGIHAQLQHLFAYGCKDALPVGVTVVDPRFSLVTRGIAQYWEQLAGRWACPGYDKDKYATPELAMAAKNTYGQKIKTIFNQICAVSVTEEEVLKYFPVELPKEPEVEKPEINVEEQPENVPEEAPDTSPEVPEVPEVPTETKPEVVPDDSDDKSTDIATLVFNVLKKLIIMIAKLFSKGE